MLLGPEMRHHSEAIVNEHHLLQQRLAGLDAALDALVCYSEVYVNLAGSAQVLSAGRWLSGWLPDHFVREEAGVLSDLARLGPDMATFAAEMARQHREISERLRAFCKVAVELEQTTDLETSICNLKETGKELTRFMAAHMGAEERKLRSLNA